MTKWLKRNWWKVLGALVIAFILYEAVDGLVSGIGYRKQIKEKDKSIVGLKEDIKRSERREGEWMESSGRNYALAMEKEAKLRKKDREMMVKIHEKRELKKKIREMPVTQVIVRTIEIINCPDVVQQEQGIVFTLDCAKDNLAVLENVFYFKEEALDWAEQFFTSQAEVANLKDALKDFDGAYKERGVQLGKKDEIIEEWTGKFNLSENRGKAKWWKGAKTGGIIGSILGFFGGFLLAK